jgi:hypothetical protein
MAAQAVRTVLFQSYATLEPLCYESDVKNDIDEKSRNRHRAIMRPATTCERFAVGGLFLIIGASPVFADIITPSHNCSKPIKPSQFASQMDRSNFDREARLYKRCLSDFMNEQNKEARMHTEAARNSANQLKAIGTWQPRCFLGAERPKVFTLIVS